MKVSKRWVLGAVGLVIVATGAIVGTQASAGSSNRATKDLGQLSGTLSRDKLTLESALNVDLDKETVRVPLYRGKAD